MPPREYVCTGEGAEPKADASVYSDGDGRHCCYQGGRRCLHLVENQGGRRYACGLLLKYKSWAVMNDSPEYREVGEYWESVGQPWNYCEVFDPKFCCRPEFRFGRNSEMKPEEALNGDLG